MHQTKGGSIDRIDAVDSVALEVLESEKHVTSVLGRIFRLSFRDGCMKKNHKGFFVAWKFGSLMFLHRKKSCVILSKTCGKQIGKTSCKSTFYKRVDSTQNICFLFYERAQYEACQFSLYDKHGTMQHGIAWCNTL